MMAAKDRAGAVSCRRREQDDACFAEEFFSLLDVMQALHESASRARS
jgi:hypothetical protein